MTSASASMSATPTPVARSNPVRRLAGTTSVPPDRNSGTSSEPNPPLPPVTTTAIT
jgi:hypothetical protein